jgi:hypothetical protein
MNPILGVRYNAGAQGWDITQAIPTWTDMGSWDGVRLVELKKQPHHVLTIPAIGSRAFAELRAMWGPKFDKKYDEFCKENKIRTA